MSRVKGGNVEPELLKIKQNVEPYLPLDLSGYFKSLTSFYTFQGT